MARINPTAKQRMRILAANANRCCICKRDGIGLELHHIDGDNSNTIDENLAVLCVEDHDQHHRPKAYGKARHTDLSADEILASKESWERFVEDAQSDTPAVVAVINAFGNDQQIHSAKLIFQWPDETIEYERVYHLLEGDLDFWTDEIMQEVQNIGHNVQIMLIDEPLPVEYCPCCRTGFSNTVKGAVSFKATDPNWSIHSSISIYVNPKTPSLAMCLRVPEHILYSSSLHLCQGNSLHFISDYYDETVRIKKSVSARAQALRIVQKEIDHWEPAQVIIATGDPDNPEQINRIDLPEVWESEKF